MIIRWLSCFFLTLSLFAADKVVIKNLELNILKGVKNGAGYVSIYNGNTFTINLHTVTVQPEVFDHIELHDHVPRKDENGIDYMEMIEIPEIEIAPGATLFLQPGSKHLMLMNISPNLCQHKTLRFEFSFRSTQGNFSKTIDHAPQHKRCINLNSDVANPAFSSSLPGG